MAESNSDIVVCPCGFFGRSETNGLCSKCYKEHLARKTADASGTVSSDTTAPSHTISREQISQALSQVGQAATQDKITADPTSSSQSDTTAEKEEKGESSSQGDHSDEGSSSNGTKRVREVSECESVPDESSQDTATQSKQKNKKRCFTCNCKLQPAIREIGRCKCELVFCQLHRLPEQHDCEYDHKEMGRQAAREKMVSPKKHMGNSVRRLDSYDS